MLRCFVIANPSLIDQSLWLGFMLKTEKCIFYKWFPLGQVFGKCGELYFYHLPVQCERASDKPRSVMVNTKVNKRKLEIA